MNRSFRAIVLFIAILSLIPSPFQHIASASSDAAAATITSITGKATVRLAGGSKTVRAFPNMFISKGDQIQTGADGSVTLAVSQPRSVRTIGPNSIVTISKLAKNQFAIKLLSGSLWSSVDKVPGFSTDAVEVPGVHLNVKGTHFLVIVDADGKLSVFVASGLVVANFGSATDRNDSVLVTPAQQLNVYPTALPESLHSAIGTVNNKQLVVSLDATVISAILNSASSIIEENKIFEQELQTALKNNRRITLEREQALADLSINNTEQLNAYLANINRFLSNLAFESVKSSKISAADMTKLIAVANDRIPASDRDLDLSEEHALQPWAGFDSDSIAAKEKEQKRLDKLNEAKSEKRKSLEAALQRLLIQDNQQISDMKKKLDAANETILAELQQQSEALYLSRLSPEDKAKYMNSKQQTVPTPPTTGSSSGSNPSAPGNSGSVPKIAWTATNTSEGFEVALRLENFTGKNALYGAEFHFLGDENLAADISSGRLLNDAYFSSANSVDTLRTISGTVANRIMTETIYAATQFGINSNVEITNGTLATIPFKAQQNGSLRLIYVKIVDRDGKTILELKDQDAGLPPPIQHSN